MIAPLILAAFVTALAWFFPRVIMGSRWADRSPTAAIVAWQAAVAAVSGGVLLIGLSLALPVLPVAGQVTWLVRASHLELEAHYLTPAGRGLALVAALASAALVVRAAYFLSSAIVSAARGRRLQHDRLALVGSAHEGGFTLVDLSTPVVYAVPGRRPTIVVTTAALAALSHDELQSVLAHERRHIRARHDLAVVVTAALARTFAGLAFFRTAHQQVSALVEVHADDAAREDGPRRAMATALVRLGGVTTSSGTSPSNAADAVVAPVASARAAGLREDREPAAVMRVRRLLGAAATPRLGERVAVGACTLSMVVAPVLLALAPAVEAAVRDCCHAPPAVSVSVPGR